MCGRTVAGRDSLDAAPWGVWQKSQEVCEGRQWQVECMNKFEDWLTCLRTVVGGDVSGVGP